MNVYIHKLTKRPTQSMSFDHELWCLEFRTLKNKFYNQATNVCGTTETLPSETKLYFKSKEQAIVYAKNNDFAYEVCEYTKGKQLIKSYTDNFSEKF